MTGTHLGSIQVSRKLPTYPSPNSMLTLTSHLWQNSGLGEGWVGGWVGSFPEIDLKCACT